MYVSSEQPEIQHLIDRWKNGDQRAAETLYATYRNDVFRLCCSFLNDSQSAEEMVQDAFTYALMNIHQFKPERASYKTWLFTIAMSRCKDHLRRKRLPFISLVEWFERSQREPADPEPLPEGALNQKEKQAMLWSLVQSLSPKLREALILRYWADCTYQEIAEIARCPLSTAQSRVRLAYDQLRTQLHPDWLEELQEEIV
jgi:RNA polymerase sigma-70 factor (ECF subfamily)